MSKGSKQRPRQIEREEYERRWAETFGEPLSSAEPPHWVRLVGFPIAMPQADGHPGDLDHIVDEMQRESLRP